MTIIQARGLLYAIGGTALLDDASLNVDEHDHLGLVGKNGAGKSTLLKILSGKLEPDGGIIHRRRGLKIAYVAQESTLPPEQSVAEIVLSGLGQNSRLLQEFYRQSREVAANPQDAAALSHLQTLQNQMDAENIWGQEALLEKTLAEWQLNPDTLTQLLSGGEKKRVSLARAWIREPEILLLDEPTNHLDLPSIIGLEETLRVFPGSFIVISHDRRFLDQITNKIIELDRGNLTLYLGNFAHYQEQKAAALRIEKRENRQFDRFLAEEEAWIREGIKARRTRNEGRVRRLKKLREERAKRREVRGKIELKLEAAGSSQIIAEFQDASFEYPKKVIMRHFSGIIQKGDKVGLIGPNGIGKTTFLKLILGELEPTSGIIKRGAHKNVLYFDQFRAALDENLTLAATIGEGKETVIINGQSKPVIGYLKDFLFSPDQVMSPVSSLSGGEKNRLLLAKLFTRPASILVLDEPTNDLDIETQELLEELLGQFKGTVFLVSHDREFLDQVITQSLVFQGEGKITQYIGGFDDYLAAAKREERAKTALAADTRKDKNSGMSLKKPQKNSSNKRKQAKLTFNETRELERLPAEITALETEEQELLARLTDPTVFKTQYQEALTWQARVAAIETELALKLERWEELETKKERLSP